MWEKTNDRLNTLEIGECLLLRIFYFSLSDVEKKSKDRLNTLKTGECLLLRIFIFFRHRFFIFFIGFWRFGAKMYAKKNNLAYIFAPNLQNPIKKIKNLCRKKHNSLITGTCLFLRYLACH